MRQHVLDIFGLLSSRQKVVVLMVNLIRIATNVLDIAGLALVGLLGTILASGMGGREVPILGIKIQISDERDLLVILGLMALFFSLKSVASTLMLRFLTRYLASVETSCAVEIAEYRFGGSLERIQGLNRGELQFSVGGSVYSAITASLYSISNIVTEGALLVAVLAVFFAVDWQSAIFMISYFTFVFYVFYATVTRRLKTVGRELRKSSIQTSNIVLTLVEAFREISTMGGKERFLALFATERRSLASGEALQRFLLGTPRFFVEISLILGMLFLVSLQILIGDFNSGLTTAGIFLAGGLRMMAALLPLQGGVAELRLMIPQSAEAITGLRLARNFREVGYPKNLPTPDQAQPLSVELRNVSYQFPGSTRQAVTNLTLAVHPGEFLAIVGPSGAGKSTLLDLILGLLTPQSGTVTIGGRPSSDYIREFPGSVSYVPQSPSVIPGGPTENVTLGMDPEGLDLEETKQILKKVSLGRLADERGRPDSSDKAGPLQLSGGERQRIGLARALFRRPDILVLDEATSALDAETEASITSLIDKDRTDKILIVVAHRLSTVRNADRIVIIEEGRLADSGTWDQLSSHNNDFARWVELLSTS